MGHVQQTHYFAQETFGNKYVFGAADILGQPGPDRHFGGLVLARCRRGLTVLARERANQDLQNDAGARTSAGCAKKTAHGCEHLHQEGALSMKNACWEQA